MRLPMVDCRSLIQFCRAFPPHINSNCRSRRRRSATESPNADHRLAAIDLIVLLIAMASLTFLILPYLKFFFCELVPTIHGFIVDLILDQPLPYAIGFSAVVLGLILGLLIDTRLRKCGNPHCKGLRRAVEYDIQLETEACVKHSPPSFGAYYLDNNGGGGAAQLELGEDRKELEAELKKMAPLNGRTVLIFRAPCGCLLGRLEVWGHKKIRRIKK